MDLFVFYAKQSNGHKKPIQFFLNRDEARNYLVEYKAKNPEAKITYRSKTSAWGVFHTIQYILNI